MICGKVGFKILSSTATISVTKAPSLKRPEQLCLRTALQVRKKKTNKR
jgi:hypothetical protein